jgi:citrate lyase subunit beta/citryl-CoA lyase
MLIRSYLYAPANRPDLLRKVATRGADAVVIELEDAVPRDEKHDARRAAAGFVADAAENAPPIYVRINSGEMGLEDVDALPLQKVTGIRVPKAEDAALIARVDAALAKAERAKHVVLHPLIESVRGLYRLDEIAKASSRIERFIFGAGDYVLDVGAEATPERLETLYARQRLVARSRYLGVDAPIAHVYTPIADLEGLSRACRLDRSMGFHGRSCIHPSQVPVVNDAFRVGEREIERARRMVEGYLEAVAHGRGSVVVSDGTFVDEAGYKRAQRVLAIADAQARGNA